MRIIHFDSNAWRDRFDDDFTDGNVARVADALGQVWAKRRPGATVLLGYGTRLHAERHALIAGSVMAAHGLHVVASVSPSPVSAVAWRAAQDPDCAGCVMLTASEYPGDWGGLLVRGPDGGSPSPEFLREVEQAVSGEIPRSHGDVERADLSDGYMERLLALVDADTIAAAAPLVACDALHGATGPLLGELMDRVGVRAIPLHDRTTKMGGSHHPEPVEPWVDECEERVRVCGATCGIAFDEGGTRMSLIDERGRMVGSHDSVPLILRHVARHHVGTGRTGKRVVTTWASSVRVKRQAEQLGYEVTVVPVGFERIYDELQEGDVVLAADERGGLCLPEHLWERDGLLASLLAIEMMVREGRTLSELVSELRRELGHMDYGRRDVRLNAAQIQTLRNVLPGLNPERVAGRTPVGVRHSDGLYLSFDDEAWMLLRPARIQPTVHIFAEAPSLAQREDLLEAGLRLAYGE